MYSSPSNRIAPMNSYKIAEGATARFLQKQLDLAGLTLVELS